MIKDCVRVVQRWVLAPATAWLAGVSIGAQSQGLCLAEHALGQTRPMALVPFVRGLFTLHIAVAIVHKHLPFSTSQQACFSGGLL